MSRKKEKNSQGNLTANGILHNGINNVLNAKGGSFTGGALTSVKRLEGKEVISSEMKRPNPPKGQNPKSTEKNGKK